LLGLILVIAFITKRAQVPYSSWLPAAMAAPTPVSSLVHSSTLVTAGVFLLIRFKLLVFFFSFILFLISLITLLLAGLMANYEWDIKKLIAFSTLSQLGFIIISFSIGIVLFTFFHLLTHALFKASLFIRSGVMIHRSDNRQEFRNMTNMFKRPLVTAAVVVCLLCLCGFPFSSGFFSKDLILDGSYLSYLLFLIYLFSVLLTLSYSFRFSWYLFLKNSLSGLKIFYMYEVVFWLCLPIWVLMLSSVFGGFLMFETYFSLKIFILRTVG
jgi:NADH-ubiquinone oxidoreductase chain 5